VAIDNTGLGIKPEDMEHIFQPFYSTKGEVKGTGLGLSGSHGIAQGHEENIRVVSRVRGQPSPFYGPSEAVARKQSMRSRVGSRIQPYQQY